MAELNQDQTLELNRDNKLVKFLDIPANNAIWIIYAPFKNKVITLKADMAELLLLAPIKEETGTGITISKSQLKFNFAMLVADMFDKTKDYAIEINDTDLEAKVNYTFDDIIHMKDAEILPLSTNLSTKIYTTALMADAEFITYEVTAGNVSDAVTIATNFNDKIGEAQSVEITSDTANSDINDQVTKIRKSIASLIRLAKHFRISNNTFFKGFNVATKKDDIGVRHTGTHAKATLAGVGVENAKITIGVKSLLSGILGTFPPLYVQAGDKLVTCELTGQPTKSVIHHCIQGDMDDINFNF